MNNTIQSTREIFVLIQTTYRNLANLLTDDSVYRLSIDRNILVDLGPTGEASVLRLAKVIIIGKGTLESTEDVELGIANSGGTVLLRGGKCRNRGSTHDGGDGGKATTDHLGGLLRLTIQRLGVVAKNEMSTPRPAVCVKQSGCDVAFPSSRTLQHSVAKINVFQSSVFVRCSVAAIIFHVAFVVGYCWPHMR